MGLTGIPDWMFGPLGPLVIPVALIAAGYLGFKLMDFAFDGRSWW